MRGKWLAATAMIIGASGLAAGCASSVGPGAAKTAGSSSPSQAAPSQAGPSGTALTKCVTPKLIAPGRTFTISLADNGKSFCVTAGTGAFVFLHGTAAHLWTVIHPSSAALQRRPSGVMALTVGTTGGYFVATQPGVATLTSTRMPCQKTCIGQVFRVTLVISGRA
jgi:hypothetical protein